MQPLSLISTLKSRYFFVLFTLLVFISCKKDENTEAKEKEPAASVPTPIPTGTSSLSIDFISMAGSTSLVIGAPCTNNFGELYTISRFDYYISNIELIGENVGNYKENESYHLIRSSDQPASRITMNTVPAGRYKAIRFMLGVDSARNMSGSQTGDLDPSYGMFWTWSTGYIMLKLEGTAPASALSGNVIEYHLGGYKGPNKVQRTIQLSLQNHILELTNGSSASLKLSADVNAIFDTPNEMRISQYSNISSAGNNARRMSENCADMFKVESWQ